MLRSKTPDLVLQELWGLLRAHFAVRQLMAHAAWPRGLDPDRLSFTHAVRVIKRKMSNYDRDGKIATRTVRIAQTSDVACVPPADIVEAAIHKIKEAGGWDAALTLVARDDSAEVGEGVL